MRWLILVVSVLAYMVAVINRGSFATLGTVAQHHFGAEATVVSLFITVQLVVYALAQIPVGIFLDTKGPALVMSTGLTVIGIGQFILGQSETVPLALLARFLVGAGDACIFACLIRVISLWFSHRTIPTVNQVSGLMGQSGQLIAVAPLAALVGATGWQGAFTVLALVTWAIALAAATIVKNSARESTALVQILRGRKPVATVTSTLQIVTDTAYPFTQALPVLGPNSSGVLAALKALAKRPGVRMAFWIHWSTGFSAVCFTLLWGVAFMRGGLGYSFDQAANIVNIVVFAGMVGGVLTGPVVSRFARIRVHIALICAGLNMSVWTLIVLWQGKSLPFAVMAISAVLMGVGGPMSMVAFDVVRTYSPPTQRGIATGFANMGGFTAGLICILLIGIALDLQGAGSPATYSYLPFKWAMGLIVPIGTCGIVMAMLEYRKTKKYLSTRK